MKKVCSTCKDDKSVIYFHKDSSNKDGYRNRCKKCCAKTYKNWYSKNKKKKIKQTKKRYYKDHEFYLFYARQYYRKNKKHLNKIDYKRKKQRKLIDVNFKIVCNLRTRIYNALKGRNKSNQTKELLGCSIETFKQHLEQNFTKGMNWKNYGRWHIDHIRPCSSFDMSDPEQQKQCFHYSNLQPLWAKDNLKKSDRF
jgi:hypothetical protein